MMVEWARQTTYYRCVSGYTQTVVPWPSLESYRPRKWLSNRIVSGGLLSHERMDSDPLREAERSWEVRGRGRSLYRFLGLQVGGHGEVVILPNLVVVCVHPVHRSLPLSTGASPM